MGFLVFRRKKIKQINLAGDKDIIEVNFASEINEEKKETSEVIDMIFNDKKASEKQLIPPFISPIHPSA